jgi:DNA polymerase-3 subunit alpha
MDEDEKSLVQIDYNLAIFAVDMDGYYNIIKIHNDAQINGFTDKPKTNDSFLETHGKGVIAVLPTPFSEVSTLAFNGNWKEAKEKFDYYDNIFDDVYVAIPIVEEKEYSEIDDTIIKFCTKYNIKMIPVLNSHYIYPKDESLLETMNKMQKIKSGVKLEVDFLPKMYYRDYNEVYDLWKELYQNEIFNESVFAKINLNLDRLLSKFEILPLDTSPKTPHFENCEQVLREKCFEGLKARGLEGNQEYLERMEYELENIVKAGFADYFVLLEDLCTWCWNNGVHTGTGRGSAAGSLVLYLLNITHADPIKYNLLFERFLSADKLQEIIEKGGKVTGCFSEDTIVRLIDNYKYISDVKVGDVVIGDDNKPHKVLRVLKKGLQDTIRVVYELDNKLHYFDCTKGHRLSIIENNSVVDKRVGEIK